LERVKSSTGGGIEHDLLVTYAFYRLDYPVERIASFFVAVLMQHNPGTNSAAWILLTVRNKVRGIPVQVPTISPRSFTQICSNMILVSQIGFLKDKRRRKHGSSCLPLRANGNAGLRTPRQD
jgi:hypothetical protein